MAMSKRKWAAADYSPNMGGGTFFTVGPQAHVKKIIKKFVV